MAMVEPFPSRISSFGEWRAWVTGAGLQPVIVVAGSRGKTIVSTLLESILRAAGLRIAVWSSFGVDVDGVRQAGELGPWQDIEHSLESGEIDVAIREVD